MKYMRIILLTISLFCFSLLTHGQRRVLKVTLEEIIPYDTLKCSAVFEYFDKMDYLGEYQVHMCRQNCYNSEIRPYSSFSGITTSHCEYKRSLRRV